MHIHVSSQRLSTYWLKINAVFFLIPWHSCAVKWNHSCIVSPLTAIPCKILGVSLEGFLISPTPQHFDWLNVAGDVIWRHGTRSTLAQVMACCLMAPSHYLNQCWLIIGEVPWHSSQGIILRRWEDTKNKIENCSFKMASRSPRGQWVNSLRPSDAYVHQYARPSLVQMVACHLFSNKPLPEPMMTC